VKVSALIYFIINAETIKIIKLCISVVLEKWNSMQYNLAFCMIK